MGASFSELIQLNPTRQYSEEVEESNTDLTKHAEDFFDADESCAWHPLAIAPGSTLKMPH
jgi:hypothetical protein